MDHPTLESLDLVAAIEALPMPGWLCDRRGRLIHTNARWASYLGGESHLRPHWLVDRFLHPHDIVQVRDAWHAALESGREFDIRVRLHRFDDSWRWHVLHATPVGGAADPGAAWLGTWTDVDDALAEIEELRLMCRLLQAKGEASLDATILASPDRKLVWANRRAYELWGVDRDEYPFGSDLELAADRLADRVQDSARNREILDTIYNHVDRVMRDDLEMADGRIMERYSTPVIDIDGELVGRMNTYRDVTTSRRRIHALHERAQAALALDYVADAVFLIDDAGVVHLWNSGAELLTGIRSSDAVDRRINDLLPDWAIAGDLVPVLDDLDTPRTASTLPLVVAGGREAWVSAVGVRFDRGIVYALRDVSDDERLDRMRSDIVATVSHELRTPLTSIYGMAITLQDDDHPLDDGTRARLLSTIVEQCARLGSILDDILVANGLESGSVRMRPRVVDVHEVVARAVELVSSTLPPPTRISVESDPGLPLVAADGARTQQALVNLLENAVKYSPGGGAINVRVRMGSSSDVAIDVTDHGLGIPATELDHVFDKFHRLDPSMTLGIAGTGLGLYIARELARRMHGDVTVHSIEGAGSTFTLTLPVS